MAKTIEELNAEIKELNYAKNEALKWYEDACKEIDRLNDRIKYLETD